jgi:hypothetical protein
MNAALSVAVKRVRLGTIYPDALTSGQALDEVIGLVASGQGGYIVTRTWTTSFRPNAAKRSERPTRKQACRCPSTSAAKTKHDKVKKVKKPKNGRVSTPELDPSAAGGAMILLLGGAA